MGEGGDLANLMPQRRVAIGAFDLVVGDMFFMHKLRGIFRSQEDRFIMTFDAFPFGDMAIPLYHAEMALLAGDPPGNILFVIEVPTFDFDISFRLHVAGGTSSDGARNAVLLSLGASFVIVTDEAVDFMDGQVFSLNELSVTTGAAELHFPSQFSQMFSV
jgi:hypothetical protein